MKKLIPLILAVLAFSGCVFAQTVPINAPSIYNTMTFYDSTLTASGFLAAASPSELSISSAALNLQAGSGTIALTAGAAINIVGDTFGWGTPGTNTISIPLNLNSGADILAFNPLNGGTSVTFKNVATNGGVALLASGSGTASITSPTGTVNITAAAGIVNISSDASGVFPITLSGNVIPGVLSPTGRNNLGNSSAPFADVWFTHLEGVRGAGISISAGSGSGSGSATLIGGDSGGQISVTTGGSPGAGDLCNVTFARTFAHIPYVTLWPANAASSTIMTTGAPYTSASATTFRLVNVATPAGSTTYLWNYQVVDGPN